MTRDWNALLDRVRAIRAGKSRSYVADAQYLAEVLEELIVEHTSFCVSSTTYLELEKKYRVAVDINVALQKRINELKTISEKL